jgi:GntR family transcriptional regulator/MocR family aminotransferase
MRKIPTNSSGAPRKAELPLDLSGPHITHAASSQQRLYQALCHAITGGIAKPGEPLPPSRTLAKQTGFRRNAITSAYERLIADGFAVAKVGSGTFVAARIPSRANDTRKARIAIAAPQQGALALGCTHVDEKALQRFRSFAGRRMRAFGTEHLQYGDPRGSRELRAAIADHLLSARGLRCDPDQIMLTSGTLHSLRIALSAILKPGNQIWPEDPGYPVARKAIEHCGQRPVPVPVDASGIMVAKGRALAPTAGAAYVTPSHQFPLGVHLSLPRRSALLDFARAHGAVIIEDDYDGEFRFAGKPLDALKTLDNAQTVFYIGTFSKSLFPSLRLGFVIAPGWALHALVAAKQLADWNAPLVAQDVLTAFIAEGHLARHVRKMRRIYSERHDILQSAIERFCSRELKVVGIGAGLHLAALLTGSISATALIDRAQAAGIRLHALQKFAAADHKAEGLVFGYGAIKSQQIGDGMRQLARLM